MREKQSEMPGLEVAFGFILIGACTWVAIVILEGVFGIISFDLAMRIVITFLAAAVLAVVRMIYLNISR